MSKNGVNVTRNATIDQAAIDRLTQAGRGQGDHATYIPWKIIQGTPSRKTTWRVFGWKTGREHHFFSPLEYSYFCILDWSSVVTDICEHKPLLPLEDTLAIAQECGFDHPSQKTSSSPTRNYSVLMTDFLITCSHHGKSEQVARTVLYGGDLEKSSYSMSKLEIEKRYWATRGIDWGIVTDSEIPSILAKNVDTIHSRRQINQYIQLPQNEITEIAVELSALVQKHTDFSLRKVALLCDTSHDLKPGSSMNIAWYLIATRQWHVDMLNTLLDPSRPLTLQSVKIIGVESTERNAA